MSSDSEELISFSEEELNGQRLVPATRLHEFLGNKKRFSDWFKHRAKKYQLEHGVDYITIATPSGDAKRGGHNTIEYGLTINAAKELSMVEGTAKGKVARAYFLRKEQLANFLQKGVMQMMLQMQERMEQLEKNVQLALPPSEAYTIMGFSRLLRRPVTKELAIKLGKRAVQLSQVQGLPVTLVPDARYGSFNSYCREVLEAVFAEQFPLL